MTRRRAKLFQALAAQAAAAVPAASTGLEIAELKLFPLREPVSGRTYMVIRVGTRSGLAGFGECSSAANEDLAAARTFWTGRPATAWVTTHPGTRLDGAINMALLDIVGQSTRAPVYRLLGGPTRNKVRALALVEPARVDQALASGYRAVSVRIPAPAARNQGQKYQLDVRRVAEALRAKGADFVLDASGSLTPGDAASVAATIQPLHPLWFNEPCAVSNLQTIRKIAEESVMPLGFGAGITNGGEFQQLLRYGLIDVVRPDLAHFGITGTRRIAALAETYYVAVAPGHDGGPVATAAALHLAASLPNFFIQQIPLPEAEADRKMRAELAGDHLERVAEGFMALPAGPGLGLSMNEAALEKYRAS